MKIDDCFRVLAGICGCTLGSGFLCGMSCINNRQNIKRRTLRSLDMLKMLNKLMKFIKARNNFYKGSNKLNIIF